MRMTWVKRHFLAEFLRIWQSRMILAGKIRLDLPAAPPPPCFPPSSKRRKSEGTISVRTFSNYIFLFPFCFIIPNVRSSSYFWRRRRRYEVLLHTKQLDVWKLDGGGGCGSSLVCSTFFKSNGIAKFMTLQLTKLVATTATEGRNCQNHFKYRQRGNVGEGGSLVQSSC